MERDNLARAVQADEVIVVFMDEDQRKIFRDSSGTIIVSSVENIFTIEGYQFYSVCVLDSQGEATPICQAISANDFNTTARIMLETMKLLEPTSVCKIHCLMAPGHLEEPFIQALSQTLVPNSELLTYPVQPTWVETYEYMIQSSLKPIVSRLDQLIYSVFKMNEFIQSRHERHRCGFYGKNKSRVQKLFTSLHESYDLKDTIKFQIVEATTRDVRDLESDISTKTPVENPAWEISKFDGDVLVESNLVSAFPIDKLFCVGETCQVHCDVCKKDFVGENIPCAHSFSCDCAEYNRTYNCIHIHFITQHILRQKTSSPNDYLTPTFEKIDDHVTQKSDHNYVNEQSTCNEKSDLTDTANSQDDVEKVENIRPCQVKLQKLENIDLNKALSTPFLKTVDPQIEENELLQDAINKLTSAAKYLRSLKEKKHLLGEKQNGDTNGLRKSFRKRKRPHLKNMCLDVIEFIESNFPSTPKNVNKSLLKEDVEHSPAENNVDSEVKPTNRSLEPSPELLKKCETEILEDEKDLYSKGNKTFSHKIIGDDVPRYNLLKAALHANVNDISWCTLACGNHDKNLEMLANLEQFDINDRETILEKFILAKSLWRCKKCKDSSSVESMLSGFITCKLCQHWFHRNCSIGKESLQVQQPDKLLDDYVCERCMSLFLGHASADQMPVEVEMSNQDSLQLQAVSVDAAIPISEVAEKRFIVENIDTESKLNHGGQQIEFIQAQQPSEQAQEISEEQISSGTQIYYQLPPNVSFPTNGEGHYVVQLQDNTVQQIGFEVI